MSRDRHDRVMSMMAVFMVLFLACAPGPAQEAHVGEQVVFRFDHQDTRGRFVMEATEVRIAYTIEPIEGSHPAPMPSNTLAICRPYNEGPRLYLRCGPDRYSVANIALIPKKKSE